MKDVISFARGVPPVEVFPNEELLLCTEHVIRNHSAQALQYGNGAGYGPLRRHIATQYHVPVNRVVTGQGSLQLLDHLIRVTIQEGDLVFVEQPTYDRVLTLFKRAGAKLIGIGITNNAVDIEAVREHLKNGKEPKYFYSIADFQNPSGTVMSLNLRKELTALANQYGFLIIEDGPYRHLRYKGNPIPRLFDLAPDNVVYMSSYSKRISPGLRTGYMILPEKKAQMVIQMATDSYVSPSYFDQAIVLDFIDQGFLEKQINRLVKVFSSRIEILLAALEDHMGPFGNWTRPDGGFYVGLTLNKDVQPVDINKASEQGLLLTDGRGFFLDGGERFVRLPFCALKEEQITEGVRRLAEIIQA